MKLIVENLYSAISALWVVANLTFWVLILIPVTLVRIVLPFRAVRKVTFFLVDFIYRAAVNMNSFWMTRVVGISLHIEGEIGNDRSPIVICNHQSWFDIPILQEIITSRGPIVRFLVKRELIWVPVIGWICLAMNFPRLNRGSGRDARQTDYSTIQSASLTMEEEPGALLIFPEGTRFTEAKRDRQQSPWEHLLRPRVGGMKIIKANAPPETPIIDITICYDRGVNNFWQCLHGEIDRIHITIEHFRLSDIDDIADWLQERWNRKEERLSKTIDADTPVSPA